MKTKKVRDLPDVTTDNLTDKRQEVHFTKIKE